MNSYGFAAVLLLLSHVSADPLVIWNVKSVKRTDQLAELLTVPTVEKPMVVFVKEMFDLGELSRAGDVYSAGSTGGRLSHLKEWMTSSKGYSVLYGVEEPMLQLRESIEPKVDSSAVRTISESQLSGSIPEGFALLYVAIPKDIESLDDVAKKFSKLLNGNDYTAVLFGKAPQIHRRVERAVGEEPAGTKKETLVLSNVTFINDTILFFAKKIQFKKGSPASKGKGLVFETIDLDPSRLQYEYRNLSAENGTLTISGKGFQQLESITIKLSFSRLPNLRSKQSAWEWVNGNGLVTYKLKDSAEKTETLCSATRIETEGPFSYSCQKPSIFWAFNYTSDKRYACTPINKKNEAVNAVGLKFTELQIQYFPSNSASKGKFSEANDCVGFFSIGIWMGLFAMVVMLLIFAFGIIMITDLKTQGRFDDPRGKPLQINAKE